MNSYLEDVDSQPQALMDCIRGIEASGVAARLEALCQTGPEQIIFAGMGSSNYCSVSADILLCNKGVFSRRYSASELLHYQLGALTERTMLVLTSQSGESAEIVRLIAALPRGVMVIAVTNDADSTLARRADCVLPMSVEPEEAVTTRTFLASIVLNLLVARCLTGFSFGYFLQSLLKVSKDMKNILLQKEDIREKLKNALGEPPQLCLLGRGHSVCTVNAGTLFLREIVKYPAFGELCGEFRHGPMEMVDESFYGLVLAPEDGTTELQYALAEDIRAKGGHVAVIGNRLMPGIPTVILPKTDEWLSPLTTILPVQIYADHLAGMRGVEAGKFRWGSKITRAE